MTKRKALTEEEFSAWRDNPITQHVFSALSRLADRAKENWLQASWERGNVDLQLLADLRARAEIIADLVNIQLGDITDDKR